MQNFSDGKIPVKDNKASTLWDLAMNTLSGIYEASELEIITQWIFEYYTGLSKNVLKLDPDKNVNQSVIIHFCNAVEALKKHTPVQYVIGEVDFYKLQFYVNPDVLIPRPETEELVDLIIKQNPSEKIHSILDIGTGSGCIAISLAHHFKEAKVTAIDISEGAVKTASGNAEKNNVSNIEFVQVDFLENYVPEKEFDLIVSNPPYIGMSESALMEENVLRYEPHQALFVADNDPLVFYRKIADEDIKNLKTKGLIYLEINEKYGTETLQLFQNEIYLSAELVKDMFGKNRFIKAIKK